MILDTTVLIDLQRELRRGQPGPASALLAQAGDDEVAIAFVSWMEFAEGYGDDQREALLSQVSTRTQGGKGGPG